MKADIIIPAFNESNKIENTLKSLINQPWVNEVIVVDDGSEDGTEEIALRYTQKVFKHEKNKGKMAAVFTGIQRATGEWIILLDGDIGETASEAKKLLTPLIEDHIDMTIAVLPQFKQRGFGLVKKRARNVVYRETGVFLTAPLSGQRAFHRNWIPIILSHQGKGFGLEMYLNLTFLKHGAKLREINTNMSHRTTRKDLRGFRHRAKQWLEMEITLWNFS
ncbi:glycosyltransferase involved in cell wall biosynthesis [Evansella vedderi]|uniref:Glycosyltransferase involved in cell wall biosynthesis n=1 Tax=Evansella vedderi TaxID=38282 RepID=A0ABT9ZYD4_9BACI|nr:glycosyltransferase family 2 protein [Evansella vedderi]MDQ0256237.1 glycosyltransferase involved in cell wall biosynthesis [Evansella vedderi]